MEKKCLLCDNIVLRNCLCSNHYTKMIEYKFLFIKEKKTQEDMKNHYHNLRYSIMRQKNIVHIVECSLRLIGLAEAYLHIYKDSSLTEKVYPYTESTYITKAKNIANNNKELEEIINNKMSDMDFRKKWSCDFGCTDGHKVRSLSEELIDNWLFYHNISHIYEKQLIIDKDVEKPIYLVPDFYLPEYRIYIEYWGKYTDDYIARKEAKIFIYNKYEIKYIGLNFDDLKELDFIFERRLKR